MPPKEYPGPSHRKLWDDRPRVGDENAIHRKGLDGEWFTDLATMKRPVLVQEVYVMDPFMRALAEFRSPQGETQKTIPFPCHDDERVEDFLPRIFMQARANLEALRTLPRDVVEDLYTPEEFEHDEDCFVRSYDWSKTFFGDGWTEEAGLERYAYPRYADYLDPSKWMLVAPPLVRGIELRGTQLMRMAKSKIADYKIRYHFPETKPEGKATHDAFRDALYLLPTHVKLQLVRRGYGRLEYLVPRSTTWERLQATVEADLGETFETLDIGYSKRARFGPGKTLGDVLRPTTFLVAQAWS